MTVFPYTLVSLLRWSCSLRTAPEHYFRSLYAPQLCLQRLPLLFCWFLVLLYGESLVSFFSALSASLSYSILGFGFHIP